MQDDVSSWLPINLKDYLDGEYSGPQPTLFSRTDGRCLLYSGKLHSIAGPPGSGKSWVALAAAADVLARELNVLFLDFEDSPDSVVSRLRMIGVEDHRIMDRFGYVSPSEPIDSSHLDALNGWLDLVDLVILDGVTDAMLVHSLDPLKNHEAAAFMRDVVQPLRLGVRNPAQLLIDHVPKSKGNRRAPVGAQHKLAAVQVQYVLEEGASFDQDNAGSATLDVVKDRFGQVQRFSVPHKTGRAIAKVHFRPGKTESSQLNISLDPPTAGTSDVPIDDVTFATIREQPGLSKTELKKAVPKREAEVAKALDRLVAEGRVISTLGEGQRSAKHFIADAPMPTTQGSREA